jgi:leucyl/phenylalanyl-tRNA---protein transferase
MVLANVEMPIPLNAGMREQDQLDKRASLFRETPSQTAMRWIMGTAYACHPKRIADLPYLWWGILADLARGGTRVPDSAAIHPRPDTFGGVVRGICPETILAAARRGFFPWCHFGPLKWWTRSQRMVLFSGEQHIPKRLAREMRKTTRRVTFDQAFDEVVKSCAGHRKGRPAGLTWITPQIMRLYSELFDLGHAHSFEVWSADGKLIGGGYGLSVGRVFYGESQFSLETNTSKMGFVTLNHHLAKWGYVVNDGKDYTGVIGSLGFRAIPRAEYEAILAEHGHTGDKPGPWTVEDDLATIAS